ncbi:MAG: hypothetical protein KF708_17990 [Pirellulales bacterium]|nr:hypothetical protein [Pirellulales bacterium]
MIGLLLRALVALFVYSCVATVLSLAIILGYLMATQQLDEGKISQISAVLQGIDLAKLAAPPSPEAVDASQEQASYEAVVNARAVKLRDIELRLISLRQGLGRLDADRMALTAEKSRLDRERTTFDERLAELQNSATSEGENDVRSILESVKPKQAKELILKMVDSGEMQAVVNMLSQMPVTKQAKIVAEFRTPEETEKLQAILRQIQLGEPLASLVDETRNQSARSAQEAP